MDTNAYACWEQGSCCPGALNITVGTVGGTPMGSVLVFLQDAAVKVRIKRIPNEDVNMSFTVNPPW
ncbi:MAG: hypothetical protein HBSIN02_16000 [Bacteroidia bacterium]|nr:MAG: hypothetical protein HBSIN02_16000 [Bacteroidia bacterium]